MSFATDETCIALQTPLRALLESNFPRNTQNSTQIHRDRSLGSKFLRLEHKRLPVLTLHLAAAPSCYTSFGKPTREQIFSQG